MATTTYTPKAKDPRTVRSDVEDVIRADSYNLPPDFFNKYQKKFEDIRDSVNSIIRSYGFIDKKNADINNPLADFNLLLYNTIDKNSYQKELMLQNISNLTSGARSITQENTATGIESEIIQGFQRLTEDTFALMSEYHIAVSLIPELKRVMKLIVRDILNANEITKRSIKDVYKVDQKSLNLDENELTEINKLIDEEITDKYRIEKNLPVWLYEMLVTGAKPILVVPYKDIVKQSLTLANLKNSGYSLEDTVQTVEKMSYEDCEIIVREQITQHNLSKLLKTDIFEKKPTIKKYSRSYEDDKDDSKNFYNTIIDDKLVNEIYEEGLEQLISIYNTELEKANKEYTSMRAFGLESDENKIYETVNSIKETIDKLEGNVTDEEEDKEKKEKDREEIKNKIKKQYETFIGKIDENIDIVKEEFSGISLSKAKMFSTIKQSETSKNMIDGMYIKNANQLKEISESFDKEVLLIELDPEKVIPVTIGSEHVSYYVYEADTYAGPTSSNSRRASTFAQVVAATGFGNDKAVINAGNGVNIIPNDPAMSSLFNPNDFSNLNMPIGGSDLMEGNRRIEIMKQIVFKTIAHRMNDVSLVDNKCFQDAIMSLIRQGYIINRKVQFTHVPATNMVYFAHDIDDKGLPHSVLDGTLLQIYMYLAGIVSATLDIVRKSSDKEKLEVNMGISKQIGFTLMEIQKNLATRNIHVRSFFDNIGSVLRNTATYLRLTIPVVDGEKLYDVSNVESNVQAPIDTEFINQRLESILSAIPCPPSITNMIKEAEFSRGIINQNIEYRNSILERQVPVCQALTKLYRLIALYQGIAFPKSVVLKHNIDMEKNKRKDPDIITTRKIDVMDMVINLSPPMYLNMVNIQEVFTNIEPVIENYLKFHYGTELEEDSIKPKVKRARKELAKFLATQIDFNVIEEFLNRIDENVEEDIINDKKAAIIGEGIGKMGGGDDSGGF